MGGYEEAQIGAQGLLLSESEGSWATGVGAALPANAYGSLYGADLTAVSCPSAIKCTGVGNYDSRSSGVQGLLMTITPPPLETLNISKRGRGYGTVSSFPAGLSCGAACSHAYPEGAQVSLTATPAVTSSFAGWDGACTGTGKCAIAMHHNRTTTATFKLMSTTCVVPKLTGRTLSTAELSIKYNHCSVGRIKHAWSRTTRRGHVISEKPKPGRRLKRGAKVNLVISNGPPR